MITLALYLCHSIKVHDSQSIIISPRLVVVERGIFILISKIVSFNQSSSLPKVLYHGYNTKANTCYHQGILTCKNRIAFIIMIDLQVNHTIIIVEMLVLFYASMSFYQIA